MKNKNCKSIMENTKINTIHPSTFRYTWWLRWPVFLHFWEVDVFSLELGSSMTHGPPYDLSHNEKFRWTGLALCVRTCQAGLWDPLRWWSTFHLRREMRSHSWAPHLRARHTFERNDAGCNHGRPGVRRASPQRPRTYPQSSPKSLQEQIAARLCRLENDPVHWVLKFWVSRRLASAIRTRDRYETNPRASFQTMVQNVRKISWNWSTRFANRELL